MLQTLLLIRSLGLVAVLVLAVAAPMAHAADECVSLLQMTGRDKRIEWTKTLATTWAKQYGSDMEHVAASGQYGVISGSGERDRANSSSSSDYDNFQSEAFTFWDTVSKDGIDAYLKCKQLSQVVKVAYIQSAASAQDRLQLDISPQPGSNPAFTGMTGRAGVRCLDLQRRDVPELQPFDLAPRVWTIECLRTDASSERKAWTLGFSSGSIELVLPAKDPVATTYSVSTAKLVTKIAACKFQMWIPPADHDREVMSKAGARIGYVDTGTFEVKLRDATLVGGTAKVGAKNNEGGTGNLSGNLRLPAYKIALLEGKFTSKGRGSGKGPTYCTPMPESAVWISP